MNISEAIHLIHLKILLWLKEAVSHVPNLLIAILVVILFGAASGYIKKAVVRLMSRVTGNTSLVNLTSSFLRLFVIAIGIFVALNILGLNQAVTSLLAGAGIIGLALGFAFQDLTANFLSGAFIAIQQPIRVGDVVETNGYFGMVKAINIRSTIIGNFGGQEIEIPSRDIFQKPIVNFSKSNERRMQLNCGVSYDDDLQKAQEVAMAAIQSLPFLQPGKPVEFHYQNFSDRSVTFFNVVLDRPSRGRAAASHERCHQSPQESIRRKRDHHSLPDPNTRNHARQRCSEAAGGTERQQARQLRQVWQLKKILFCLICV